MPKPMYVWTGTAWVSVASEVESLATYATQSYADAQPGMKLVVPTSIAVGSGTGSVATSGSVSFSGASSVSLNDVFSTTYDNYFVFVDFYSASTDANSLLRLRASGTDASGSDYNFQAAVFTTTTSTISRTSATSSMNIGASGTTYGGQIKLHISRPFTAAPTRIMSENNYTPTSTGAEIRLRYGLHTLSTSYTGFTFYPDSGNVTGSVSVYGYKD